MEGNLERLPQIIKIDWERLDEKEKRDANPHERIILEALDTLKGKGFDESFIQSYEVRSIIEGKLNNSSEGYASWEDKLKKSEDSEKDENELAESLVATIMLKLDDKDQRKAA